MKLLSGFRLCDEQINDAPVLDLVLPSAAGSSKERRFPFIIENGDKGCSSKQLSFPEVLVTTSTNL